VPVDGTVVEGLPSRSYWVFASGYRKLTFPSLGAVPVDDAGLAAYRAIPCLVPRLTHLTLPQVRRALQSADCRLGKVTRRPITRRAHTLHVIKQTPRPQTRHPAYHAVRVTLG